MNICFFNGAKLAVVAALMTLFVGCSSNGEKPGMALNSVESKLEVAKQMEAQEFAPLALKSAEKNIDSAKDAVDEEEYKKARRFIEKAEMDLRLASAKTKAAKASNSADQIRDNLDVLKDNI